MHLLLGTALSNQGADKAKANEHLSKALGFYEQHHKVQLPTLGLLTAGLMV